MGRRKKFKRESSASVLLIIRKDRLDDTLERQCPGKRKRGRQYSFVAKCHQDHGLWLSYGLKTLEIGCGQCRKYMFSAMVADKPQLLVCAQHPDAGMRLSYDGTHLKSECWVCKRLLNSIPPA